jgi:hypothetical protein
VISTTGLLRRRVVDLVQGHAQRTAEQREKDEPALTRGWPNVKFGKWKVAFAECAPISKWDPRCVRASVDWYQVNARIDFGGATLEALRAALKTAQEYGRSDYDFAGLAGQISPTSKARVGLLQNADFRIVFQLPEEQASGEEPHPIAWNVNLTWEHDGLVRAGLWRLAPWTLAVLKQLANVGSADQRACLPSSYGEVVDWHVTRIDLACDVAGWKFEDGELERVVKRGATRYAAYNRADEITYATMSSVQRPDGEEFWRGNSRTGWTVSPGNAISVRCYDKLLEIKKLDPHAQQAYHDEWAANGRHHGEAVRRLEVQMRSEFLDEVGARDPFKFPEMADGIWAYVTARWIRMVVPQYNAEGKLLRMSRAPVDPRWRVFEGARFRMFGATDVIEPVKRVRRRLGSSPEQTLGCVISTLGAAGRLKGWTLPRELQIRMGEAGPSETFVRRTVGRLFAEASVEVVNQLLEVRHSKDLAVRLVTVLRAKQARFIEWNEPRVPIPIPEDVLADAARFLAERRGEELAAA